MAKAEASGDLVTIDREQRRAVRRQAFGLTLPSLAMFDRGESDANRTSPPKSRRPTRTAPANGSSGSTTASLWRQIDDTDVYPKPREGSTADIRRGAIGSFFMLLDGKTQIRVHRDN